LTSHQVPGGRVIRGKTPKNLATRLTAPVTTVEVGLSVSAREPPLFHQTNVALNGSRLLIGFHMTWHLFLDESGDRGFDFDNKNCSRFLTIAILAVSQQHSANAIRAAVKKTLKRKVNHGKKGRKRPEVELKGSSTSIGVKRYFYNLIAEEKFGVYAVSLNKRRVNKELRSTPQIKNRLYNYIARMVIDAIPFESASTSVHLIVDRSKGKKGITDFDQYVLSQLQGRLDPRAKLNIRHSESHVDLGLSAADMFCWGIFRRRERGDSEWHEHYEKKILLDEQYL